MNWQQGWRTALNFYEPRDNPLASTFLALCTSGVLEKSSQGLPGIDCSISDGKATALEIEDARRYQPTSYDAHDHDA